MTDTIDKSGFIVHFLVQHTSEISIYFIHIRPVFDIFFQVMEHIRHLDIRSSVKRTFQRTDTGSDGRVGIRSGRGSDTDRKGRVVTSTVLCLKNQ